MATLPETPKKRARVPSTGLPSPPPTKHRRKDDNSAPRPVFAPPLFFEADTPNALLFPTYQTIIPGPGSPIPVTSRLSTPTSGQSSTAGVKKEEEAPATPDMTMGEEGDDDEIECLGSAPAAMNQVARRPRMQPPQPRTPLFLPIDAEFDLASDMPPRRPRPDPMDVDDEFEFVGMGPGTPLNEVDESEQGDRGVCRACGCDCRASGSRQEDEPRRRGGGSGSQTLSNRVLGNILGLLLGEQSLLKRLQALNRRFQRWEDVAAEVGARRADFDRVRHAASWMQNNLPAMKRQGRF